MFWQSVLSGLSVLGYWETYAAAALYLAIWIIPAIVIGTLVESETPVGTGLGCLGGLMLLPLQVFASAIFVLSLFPIILHLSGDATWSFPWLLIIHDFWGFLKMVGLMILGGFIVSLIPMIGTFSVVVNLVIHSIALISILALFQKVEPTLGLDQLQLFPGIGFTIGILIVSGITTYLGLLLIGVITVFFEARMRVDLTEWLGLLTGGLLGFIPLFIFGRWLGMQIM